MRPILLTVFVALSLSACAPQSIVDEEYLESDEKADTARCPAVAPALNRAEAVLQGLSIEGASSAPLAAVLLPSVDLELEEDDGWDGPVLPVETRVKNYFAKVGAVSGYKRLHGLIYSRNCGSGYFIGEVTLVSGGIRRVTVYANARGVAQLSIEIPADLGF